MRKISGYLSIAALLIFVVLDANTPIPGAATYGESINPPDRWAQADPDRFVVSTYNIRRSKGEDNKRDISRAADVLRDADADIIGIAESMLANKQRRRPVVDQGKLVGQITCRQLLGALLDFGT